MKVVPVSLLLFAFVAIPQGCTSKSSPIVIVKTPHFVPQSPLDSVVETGIRQDPATGGIVLQWFSDVGASGYKIYRSDTVTAENFPFGFSLIANIGSTLSLADTTFVDVKSLFVGVRYYYYLIAYASDGTVSHSSDTTNYRLLVRPDLYFPVNNAKSIAASVNFHWHDNTGGGYTVLRVVDVSAIPPKNIWVSKSFQTFDSYPTYAFNFESSAAAGLVSGDSYQWRVERFNLNGSGRPYEGSTSIWGSFQVQ